MEVAVKHSLTSNIKTQILAKIKQYLREQKPYWEVEHNIIYVDFPEYNITENQLSSFYEEANQIIVRELAFSAENIMLSHAKRYEDIYQRNRKPIDSKTGKVKQDVPQLVNHYITAMDALRRKEKLLGIVTNNMVVQLHQQFTYSTENYADLIHGTAFDPKGLDLSLLTIEEKREMLQLLTKAKGELAEQSDQYVATISTRVTLSTDTEEPDEQGEDFEYTNNTSKVQIEDIDFEDISTSQSDIEQGAKVIRDVITSEAIAFDKQQRRKKIIKILKDRTT